VPSPGRLYAILARRSRLAVVFRRGPSRRVLLVAWDRADDSFKPGQELHGRIYERRCDLSPSGERLVYFAAKWGAPMGTWTAVSRPPWLTALALWPKGDAWGGGGLFVDENRIGLNHPEGQRALGPGFRLPRRIVVEPIGPWAGRGEDEPILYTRLMRDGWHIVQEGESRWAGLRAKSSFVVEPASIDARPSPRGRLVLEKTVRAIGERDGPWWVEEFALRDPESGALTDVGRLDWADWDRNGDLLFARGGRMYRWRVRPADPDPSHAREIADLREMRPRAQASPGSARRW